LGKGSNFPIKVAKSEEARQGAAALPQLLSGISCQSGVEKSQRRKDQKCTGHKINNK
jgi:hypothetical protein